MFYILKTKRIHTYPVSTFHTKLTINLTFREFMVVARGPMQNDLSTHKNMKIGFVLTLTLDHAVECVCVLCIYVDCGYC